MDTIIIATHDMQLVAEWANRMLVMHEGELIADDASEVIFKQQEILNVQAWFHRKLSLCAMSWIFLIVQQLIRL